MIVIYNNDKNDDNINSSNENNVKMRCKLIKIAIWYIRICIVFTTKGFWEVTIENWSEWDIYIYISHSDETKFVGTQSFM